MNILDWLRGTEQPEYDTIQGWADWHKKARTNHPIRYWVVHKFLDGFMDIIYSPVNLIRSIKSYIYNRFRSKTHALTSSLKRGQYHELDTRILFCLFDELTKFVECESAYLHYRLSGIKFNHSRFPWRSRDAGLAYLDSMALVDVDEKYGVNELSLAQAATFKEIKALYLWWNDSRVDHIESYDPDVIKVHYDEDDAMLLRLLKVRRHLWT